jgi:phage shock protein B
MEGFLAIICIFVILPGMVFHYITKWKQNAPSLTTEDEGLLDDMYNTARRLEERLHTIERIVAADNPDYLPQEQRSLQLEESPDPLADYREPARLAGRTSRERI